MNETCIRLDTGMGANTDKPYLSLVVTTRNDDHGGNMTQRFQIFLDHLEEMGERHSLPMELIIVEWNPDPKRTQLATAMDWPASPWLRTRIITVPAEVHAMHEHHDKFPLFQMIAKNVGIRRALGEFVLATNIDIVFSDELFSFFSQRTLDHLCFYRIDRHDIGATSIPKEFSWRERLAFCERNIIRVQGHHGTRIWGDPAPKEDLNRLHTNACGDFTLLSRKMWLRLKGYPEFHLWSIFIDGLLLHAAAALSLRQVVLREPCRIYHIEHDLGWAKTQTPIVERPSLNYNTQYLPLCRNMLARGKPLNINTDNWGLADMNLHETVPGMAKDRPIGDLSRNAPAQQLYAHWIDILTAIDGRLYYRDQSATSLQSLASLAQHHAPSVVVELGTLSGMSTRVWAQALPNSNIHVVDLSFKAFWKANEFFPIDTSRIIFHQKNILSMDFNKLWSAKDRVLFFVDAHDLPDVPIMRHVLKNALPHLPEGSIVVVDDIWFSNERLRPNNVKAFFNQFLLRQIDELQCFTGYYAPYHRGGSFMGFREVLPLMDFVNARGIELDFEKHGKHVSFKWDYLKHAQQKSSSHFNEQPECYGHIVHNPLEIEATNQMTQEVISEAAFLFKQGKIKEAIKGLLVLLNKDPGTEVVYALSICLSRLGQLNDAWKMTKLPQEATKTCRPLVRLANDLESRLGNPRFNMTGKNGLTIFAVPKPFKDHESLIQKNAIRSWKQLDPTPEIILMGREEGVAEMAAEIGARHIPELPCNEYGTPIVSDIFNKAWELADNDVLAYVNADIILLNDFLLAIEKVRTKFSDFLIVGQRRDIPIVDEIDFKKIDWAEHTKQYAIENGFLHAESGMDYFVHTRNFWGGMPPFALGRTCWDGWLLKKALEEDYAVVDGTGMITAIHQDHGYSHAGGIREAWWGTEATRNRAMAGTFNQNVYMSAAGWMFDKSSELVAKHSSKPYCITEEFKRKRRNWYLKQYSALTQKGRKDIADFYREAAG